MLVFNRSWFFRWKCNNARDQDVLWQFLRSANQDLSQHRECWTWHELDLCCRCSHGSRRRWWWLLCLKAGNSLPCLLFLVSFSRWLELLWVVVMVVVVSGEWWRWWWWMVMVVVEVTVIHCANKRTQKCRTLANKYVFCPFLNCPIDRLGCWRERDCYVIAIVLFECFCGRRRILRLLVCNFLYTLEVYDFMLWKLSKISMHFRVTFTFNMPLASAATLMCVCVC